ncbi:MAG: hypothetical protein O3A84_04935 [Proteobacteria bacterium]|nr:hypothetical protein [Pseudomonadota bacterium]
MMNRRTIFTRRSVLWLGAALLLTACETVVVTPQYPEVTFRHLPPLRLNVVDIQIVNEAPADTRAPNIAHLFPTSPARALERWAEDRLQANGTSGTARFTIHEATAVESALKVDRGLGGLFKKEQSEWVDATVRATLVVLDARGTSQASATTRATRFITLREDASLEDRRKIWFELTEKLMADFNKEMERNIRRHVAPFLAP